MKPSIMACIALLTLAACRPEPVEEEPVLLVQPNLVASAPVAVSAVAAVSSPIVAQILSASEEADVITSSKQAMANVSASDVAAAASSVAASEPQMVFLPEDDLPEVKLPDTCERYYKRVDSCFAKQSENSEELRLMNQEARVDLPADKPTDSTCEALNRSFDAVARNLGCE